jgi:hypothetical protein
MEAAGLPAAIPLEPAEPSAYADAAGFANRFALGLAAGLIAMLIYGEGGRLSSQELTWRALLGS